MVIDFGKFGKRVSYGRFAKHPIEEVKKRLVLGVLNFTPRHMEPAISEVWLHRCVNHHAQISFQEVL